MRRDDILNRIRQACRKSKESPYPTRPFPTFREVGDPVDRFARELEMVQGVFLDGRSSIGLQESLQVILRRTGAKEILWEGRHVLENHGLPHRDLTEGDEAILISRHPSGELHFPLEAEPVAYDRGVSAGAELSASSADLGVADSGTVLFCVRPGRSRLCSVLPASHVAFLSQTHLVSNLHDLIQSDACRNRGSLAALITGPSRTADIEKTLVLGVHGPKTWFVVLTQ